MTLNFSSKLFTILLCSLLVLLHYEIWSPNGGLSQVWKIKQSIANLEAQNIQLLERNLVLAADVEDLKTGAESIEECARMNLGMIKKNEIFYQIIGSSSY
jgi:cell division protein FtsB